MAERHDIPKFELAVLADINLPDNTPIELVKSTVLRAIKAALESLGGGLIEGGMTADVIVNDFTIVEHLQQWLDLPWVNERFGKDEDVEGQ